MSHDSLWLYFTLQFGTWAVKIILKLAFSTAVFIRPFKMSRSQVSLSKSVCNGGLHTLIFFVFSLTKMELLLVDYSIGHCVHIFIVDERLIYKSEIRTRTFVC